MQQLEQPRSQHEARGMVGGAILIALGVGLAVQRYTPLHLGALLWPFFIIIPGGFFYLMMLLGGRGSGSLAIPATILTTLGLIFLGQSLFDYYESWAYIWTLLPTAVGIGMVIGGFWDGKPKMVQVGAHMARGGLMMLLIFATFFELFIFHSATFLVALLPLALIGGGAFLLLHGRRNRPFVPDPWLAMPTPTPTAKDDDEQLFPY